MYVFIMENITLQYILYNGNSYHPKRISENKPDIELFSSKSMTIAPNQLDEIDLDIAFQFPSSSTGFIKERYALSSIGCQILGSSVEDCKSIKLMLYNPTSDYIFIQHGKPICSLYIVKNHSMNLENVVFFK